MKKRLIYFLILGIVFLGAIFAADFLVLNKNIREPRGTSAPKEDVENLSPEITKEGAIEKIKNLPEVKDYSSELEKAGSKVQFNAEDSEEVWSVQVFEIVSQGENSHTATFNWYRVNKKTGEVSKEF